MKNKEKIRIDADKGLVKEQFKNLNKEFYSNFMREYFFIKLQNILHIITNTSEYKENINNREFELGEAKCALDNYACEELKSYAKIELTTTYFHCLETFIRLFIVHAKMPLCPWIELSKLKNEDYRKILRSLSKGNFEGLNDKYDGDTIVLFVLTGHIELPEEIKKEDLLGLKRWVVWAATELHNNYEYNTFKHGLAIYTGTNGIKIADQETIKFEEYGECLEVIKRKPRNERYVWVRKSIFVKYDSRSAIIFVFAHLIDAIISVGKFRYANGKYEIGWLPAHQFNPELIFNIDKDTISLKGIEMELLYYATDKTK